MSSACRKRYLRTAHQVAISTNARLPREGNMAMVCRGWLGGLKEVLDPVRMGGLGGV